MRRTPSARPRVSSAHARQGRSRPRTAFMKDGCGGAQPPRVDPELPNLTCRNGTRRAALGRVASTGATEIVRHDRASTRPLPPRPRSRDFSCANDAVAYGRNAQIPVIPKRRGEWVNSTLTARSRSLRQRKEYPRKRPKALRERCAIKGHSRAASDEPQRDTARLSVDLGLGCWWSSKDQAHRRRMNPTGLSTQTKLSTRSRNN